MGKAENSHLTQQNFLLDFANGPGSLKRAATFLPLGNGMLPLHAGRSPMDYPHPHRRDFLQTGSVGSLGLTLAGVSQTHAAHGLSNPETGADVRCIFLLLTGGPSHLETFDPKPLAPSTIRGPFRPIASRIPGYQLSELLPATSQHTDKFSVIRSAYHTAPATHASGLHLMQTGRLPSECVDFPAFGCVQACLRESQDATPAYVVLPRVIGPIGGNPSTGHTAGFLGSAYEPLIVHGDRVLSPATRGERSSSARSTEPEMAGPSWSSCTNPVRQFDFEEGEAQTGAFVPGSAEYATPNRERQSPVFRQRPNRRHSHRVCVSVRSACDVHMESASLRERYGRTSFGQNCLRARRLIESGVRFVTVNMFDSVVNAATWDMHGSRPFSTFEDVANRVAPQFDRAFATLLEDLSERGLLSTTLVIATGEFGRTPKINPAGGRDHHPGVWSILIGGGPVSGGRVIGSSDATGHVPHSRPVSPGDFAATVYHALGLNPHHEFPGPEGRPIPLVDATAHPVWELF